VHEKERRKVVENPEDNRGMPQDPRRGVLGKRKRPSPNKDAINAGESKAEARRQGNRGGDELVERRLKCLSYS
jgi:hypothetical protein